MNDTDLPEPQLVADLAASVALGGSVRMMIAKRILVVDPPPRSPQLGPCWIWQGSKSARGYGVVGSKYVHRLVYEEFVGQVPKGLELDHLCRVHACCNPAHLEPVTHAENVRRGVLAETNRQRGAARAHCKRGHAYTPENTGRNSGTGFRYCRTCTNDRQRAAHRARREKEAALCIGNG